MGYCSPQPTATLPEPTAAGTFEQKEREENVSFT